MRAPTDANRLREILLPATKAHRAGTAVPRSIGALLAVAVAVATATLTGNTAASAAPPTGWTKIVNDAYDRTLTDTWGSALAGGTYQLRADDVATSVPFDVANGKGSVAMSPGIGYAATLPVSTTDSQTQLAFIVPDLTSIKSGLHQTIQARVQSSGDAYRGRVFVGGSGSVTLSFSRIVAGSDVGLAEYRLPLTVTAGQQLNLELSVTGTNSVLLQARAWLDSAAQPAWQTSFTDTSTSKITKSGALGLWMYQSAGGSAFTLLNTTLQAWAPTGGGTTTAPTSSSAPTTATAPPATATAAPTTTTTAAPPTTTTTNAAAAAPSATGRGAGTIGSASFPVPSGAKFVATNGNDNNAGTQSSPYRTLAAALAKSPAGAKIVLRAGSYNESVTVDKTDITIQSYPGEAVWLDGSVPVTNWSKSGTTWVSTGWTTELDRSTSSSRGDTSTRLIRPEFPLASWPDQVFINGGAQTQVASAAAVTAGTFFVDYAANTIRIGSDPAGKSVASSNKSRAIQVNSQRVTIQGIGVRRYGTSLPDGATVRMINTEATVRNVEISDNATLGLSISNNNAVADHVSLLRNGMLGFGVNAGYNLKLTNSIIKGNNTQNFKDAPVSGGVKVTRSRGVLISNNEISANTSAGFWCDESCYDVNIVHNTVSNNSTAGVQLEISEKAVIANNLFTGNGNSVQIMNTGNVKIYNNEFGGYTYYGVRLNQDTRRNANTSTTGHDPRRPNPDPTTPWYLHDIVVSNNVFSASGRSQFYGLDPATGQSLDAVKVTINGNLFNTYTGTGAHMVGWGLANKTVKYYETPAALAAAKNTAWKNAATGQQALTSMQALMGTYNSTAVALPADIASVIGQSAGSKRVGRY